MNDHDFGEMYFRMFVIMPDHWGYICPLWTHTTWWIVYRSKGIKYYPLHWRLRGYTSWIWRRLPFAKNFLAGFPSWYSCKDSVDLICLSFLSSRHCLVRSMAIGPWGVLLKKKSLESFVTILRTGSLHNYLKCITDWTRSWCLRNMSWGNPAKCETLTNIALKPNDPL